MQKRGAVQKGFFLVVLVILAVAGFSSYLRQGATGYFTWSDFWRSLWNGGGSDTLESDGGDPGPAGIKVCLKSACNPPCETGNICSSVLGRCRCVPKYAVGPGDRCGIEIANGGCEEIYACPYGYFCGLNLREGGVGASCICREYIPRIK